MKKLTTVVVVIGFISSSLAVGSAQTNRPDFSGRWSLNASASWVDATGPTQPSFATTFMAIQDGRALTLQRKVGAAQAPLTVVYKLDGSESLNLEAKIETSSAATWQNNRLTVVTQLSDVDKSLPRNTLQRVMWLDASDRLIVETKNGVDAGYVTVYRRVN